ncbi:MAG: hypothetical protein H7Z41_12220 [Cytophagales bacterium]|nr:hypothetical protein [Armatimonadota bacterium]
MNSRHRCCPSAPFCLGLLLSCLVPAAGQAQTSPAPKEKAALAPATAAAASSEVDRLNQDLGDLELLRPLLPLNLTQSQVDSITAAMKEIASEWREVKKVDDAALKALAPDIEKAHAGALIGTPIPAEFEAKILEAQKASSARYTEAKQKALKRLLVLLNDSLTPVQKDSIDTWSAQQLGGRRIPKKYQANPSQAPKTEVQALAIVALIERTLLLDRTLVLLQQLKPASAGSAPTTGKEPKETVPAAAPANPAAK